MPVHQTPPPEDPNDRRLLMWMFVIAIIGGPVLTSFAPYGLWALIGGTC